MPYAPDVLVVPVALPVEIAAWLVTVTAPASAPEPPLPPTLTFTWLVSPVVV